MLYDNLQHDVMKAMTEKDSLKRDCLRLVISDIKNQSVNAGKELTEEICLKALQRSVKMHRDSIEQFQKAGREELAEKEKKELEVLEGYLPKMLSENETEVVIDNILLNVEATKRNFGLVMKMLPSEVDKKIASKMLGKKLR